jgi:hypothetical protein
MKHSEVRDANTTQQKTTTTQKTEKNSREAEEKAEEGKGNIVKSFRTKS